MLNVNGIVITDQNRELVAKIFALMTLSYYLEGDITFSDARDVHVQGGFYIRVYFNYGITAWTKLQGLKIEYLFIFEQGRLLQVAGARHTLHTDDYLDVPDYFVPLPRTLTAQLQLSEADR